MKVPKKVPPNGFYYHYKHDPSGLVNHYAYEVVGVGCHTEDDCRPEDANMVVYRPLHETLVFNAGKLFDLRPLEMWLGTAVKDGKNVLRFTPIEDVDVLAELKRIRKEMYGDNLE